MQLIPKDYVAPLENELVITSDDEIERRFKEKVRKNSNEYLRKTDAYVNFSKTAIAKMWLFLNDNGVQIYQFMAMGINRRSEGLAELDPKTGEETGRILPVHLNLDSYYNQGYLATGMTKSYIVEGTGIDLSNVSQIINTLLSLKWIKKIATEKLWKNHIWIPVPIYALGRTEANGAKPTDMFYIDLVDNPTSQIIRKRKPPKG